MRVTGLFLYPVKSLRGHAVSTAELDELGFVGDRRFLVVDATGKFLTQRALPRMACIDARLTPGSLTLSVEGAGSITVGTASDPSAPPPPPGLAVSWVSHAISFASVKNSVGR